MDCKINKDPEAKTAYPLSAIPPTITTDTNILLSRFDGKDLTPAYKTPKYKGPEPEPTTEVEDGKLYTGSCHCGAVTLAVKVKTLNKDYKPVTECNCSICGRVRIISSFPHSSIHSFIQNLSLRLSPRSLLSTTIPQDSQHVHVRIRYVP